MKTHKLPIVLSGLVTLILLCASWSPITDSFKGKQIPDKKTIYVYPVHISKISRVEGFEPIIAQKIVDFINENGEFKAELVARQPAVNSEWYMNEAKMLKNSCQAFTGFIKTDLHEDGYGLLVEFLWLPQEICVHYSLVDKSSGKAVKKGLANCHHPYYKEINPKNNEDAFKLFCRMFSDNFK
jgi:hypothetical protein